MSTSDKGGVSPALSAAYACDIDVAARGWDHDAWGGAFFPADLPREWRLAFYANHFRSVLVPARVLLRAESRDLTTWHADTHDEFRFFLELSARLIERFRSAGVAALIEWLAPLSDRIAGLLWVGLRRRCEPTLAPWIAALGKRFASHALIGPGVGAPAAGSSVCAWGEIRPCWHSGLHTEVDIASGHLGLMHRPAPDLPGLRGQIEAFMAYARQADRAALCFVNRPPPLQVMERARILVELLGG